MTEGLTLQMWKIKSTHLNLGRQEILRRVRLGISWTSLTDLCVHMFEMIVLYVTILPLQTLFSSRNGSSFATLAHRVSLIQRESDLTNVITLQCIRYWN